MTGRFRGASFEQALEHARGTADATGLCPPIALARGAVDDAKAGALAVWGVFNPFGSSRVRLLAVEAEGAEPASLLVHDVAHPRHPRAVAHGLVSEEPLALLRELLDLRAREGDEPVLPAPPTHVDLAASQLEESELRGLFFESLGARAELDLAAACELIEEHGADVRERTKNELRQALETVMERDRQPIRRRLPGPPSDELLARWWKLVTDTELGSREREAITELGGAHLRARPDLGSEREG